MKLIVEQQGKIVKAIKAEYTPTEALVIHHAMTRYFWDKEMNTTDRKIMEQMLATEPLFCERERYEETHMNDYDEYEYCWATGDYEGQDCEMCQHKLECAGYEGEE